MIGEALVDLIPNGSAGEDRARPGGSPFNVAVGLARLCNRTSLMARFADDPYGRMLRNTAAAEGIDLSAAPRAAEPASVMDEAVLTSAITCERAGADPPRLDEVLDRLRPGPGPRD